MRKTDVSILIVSFNTSKLTVSCIKSIEKYVSDYNYEVIVIDNNSSDDSVEKLRALSQKKNSLKIIENKKNVGFAAANNQGIKESKGEYLLLLNSDTYMTEDAVGKVLQFMNKHPEIGISGSALKNPDFTLQPSGGFFPTVFRLFSWMFFIDDIPFVSNLLSSYHPKTAYFNKSHKQDWITGAFFMVRREVIDKIGGLDPEYFMYVEEMDFCFRAAKANFSTYYNSDTFVVHLGQASSSNSFALSQELKNIHLFYKKHLPSFAPLAKTIIKIGALARLVIFAILRDGERSKAYVQIFQKI